MNFPAIFVKKNLCCRCLVGLADGNPANASRRGDIEPLVPGTESAGSTRHPAVGRLIFVSLEVVYGLGIFGMADLIYLGLFQTTNGEPDPSIKE